MDINDMKARKKLFRQIHSRLRYTAAQTAVVISQAESTVFSYLSIGPLSRAPTDRTLQMMQDEWSRQSKIQLHDLVRQMQADGVPISIGLAA